MIDFEKIVFPTDFSPCSDQALGYAVVLAEHFEAELHMLHAQVLHAEDPANPEQQFPEARALLDRLESAAHSELGEAVAESGLSVLKVLQEQRRGLEAGPVILDYAREIGSGLIVMGTHGRRGARRLLLGSVAEDVLRCARCPLLLVREAAERVHLEAIGTILAPVDFSAASQDAVALAGELARSLGARLRLLHVVEIPALPSVYGQPMTFDTSDIRRRSLDALERLAETAGASGDTVESLVVLGHPATEIVAEAKRLQAGLIVMPAHSRGSLTHLLAGRTTDLVVRSSSCPVLTVPPETAIDEADAPAEVS